MTAAQLLSIFELRRRGRPDFFIAHILGFRPRDLLPIGDAGDYEVEVPLEDWRKALDELTAEG